MSASMASMSMLYSAVPGASTPAPASAVATTPTEAINAPAANENGPAAGSTARELPRTSEGESVSILSTTANAVTETAASETCSGDVPDMTNGPTPGAGCPTVNNETSYATTKTGRLQSTEIGGQDNGTLSAGALRLGAPSPTKKSEGNSAVERLVAFTATALFCVMMVMGLL